MKLPGILVLVMLAVSLLLVSGCVTSHDFSEEYSCDDFAEDNHRSDEFEVEVGDKIRIELCSNITTGFRWTYEIINKLVLQFEDYDYLEPEDELEGAAGTDVWTFEAVGEGTAEVVMEYSQGWLGDTEAQWTYTMTVAVE
ncbi:MAG: protease inhibitor I42 family protein [Dehalococcoidales bacterium]|nr:MAG: protease inhibitor I42 family protein [Dehalococcoidales bacterium]